jgi:hypothetical protein
VLSSRVTHYKAIAPVDQTDLDLIITGDGETYLDLDIHMSVLLTAQDDSALDPTDNTTVVNSLLHSLFSQFSFTLNGV